MTFYEPFTVNDRFDAKHPSTFESAKVNIKTVIDIYIELNCDFMVTCFEILSDLKR